MRLLVLGGTAFLGRRLVEAAVDRGHEVTLFNRGRTNPGAHPGLEHLRGDRAEDLSPLAGRAFDAVLDTSGYLPRVVRASAELLSERAALYVFVSTISVYEEASHLTESTPTRLLVDEATEDVAVAYGPLKAACEHAVQAAFPGRSLVLRPGLVVGRDDYTGRFGYWPHRVAAGGEVLAPAPPGARVSLVDARDVADWTIRMLEAREGGVFNVAGPSTPLMLGAVLDECLAVTGSDATFTWVDEELLLGHGVVPYTELPLWWPESDGGYPTIDVSRAVEAGLEFRPLADTIRDVLTDSDGWSRYSDGSFGLPRPRPGLTPRREAELLEAWHARAEKRDG